MNPVFTPTRARISAEQYQKMGAAGVFTPEQRVELVDGALLNMAPIGSRHNAAVTRLTRQLMRHPVGDQVLVRSQCSVRLSDFTEVQPDVAVLRHRADDYAAANPGPQDVLLIVEVAETTRRYDSTAKRDLYARHGVPEYWVLDLDERVLAVFRGVCDGRYSQQLTLLPGAGAAPLALPDLRLDWELALV